MNILVCLLHITCFFFFIPFSISVVCTVHCIRERWEVSVPPVHTDEVRLETFCSLLVAMCSEWHAATYDIHLCTDTHVSKIIRSNRWRIKRRLNHLPVIEMTSVERTQLTGHFIDRNVFKFMCIWAHFSTTTTTPMQKNTHTSTLRHTNQKAYVHEEQDATAWAKFISDFTFFLCLFAYLCELLNQL